MAGTEMTRWPIIDGFDQNRTVRIRDKADI